MHALTGLLVLSGKIEWQLFDHQSWESDEGLIIQFPLFGKFNAREAVRTVTKAIEDNSIMWITPTRDRWQIDTVQLRHWLDDGENSDFLKGIDWLHGVVAVSPDIEYIQELVFDQPQERTYFRLNVFKEEFLLDSNTKLFLSHKGADKAMVRRFAESLRLIGFQPWLDEDDMPAGTELHRGIQQGFKESCAAVFFITPHFRDESYLRGELNYAVEQKTAKGKRFSIVTLVFTDEAGNKGVVPELLHSYVWKEPPSELEGLNEIIRAVPINVGPVSWRSGI